MKIGIDVSQIVYGTGVSKYTKNLVQYLFKIDKKNEYILFASSLRRLQELKSLLVKYFPKATNRYSTKLYPIPPTVADFVWNKLHILPIERLIGKIDVFHSSDWTQPPTNAFKVTTVHDLAPIKFPKETHPDIVKAHQFRLGWVKKEVDSVIVPSSTIKEDLVEYGFDDRKISVIPEAPVFGPSPMSNIEIVKKKYGISGEYILSVGVSPRKNTGRIFKAFESAKLGDNFKLVLVGRPVLIDPIKKREIIFTGAVLDEELSALYTGAKLLLYPSLYEGFGLPILDAYACNTPVVTSNLGNMAEIGKDAAVLVDPHEIKSIILGIRRVLESKEEFVKKGMKVVKRYSWEKTARKTLKVYERFNLR